MLLQARASINKADLTGETALIKAARMGNLQTVSLLLSSGARADIKDNNSFTALLRAAYEGHRDTVKVLLGMM
jgi:ankyrin repeat protein